MRPARGDSKPCTHHDCTGIMRYARPDRGTGDARTIQNDDLRWICSEESGHRSAAQPITSPTLSESL